MKKIYAILVSFMLIAVLSMIPTSYANETVTGSFTANGTLDVTVNETGPAFGTINVNENATVSLKVDNTGSVRATVTQDQATHDTGSLSIGTVGTLSEDEYSVEMSNDAGSSWTDIGQNDETPISSDLATSATQNYQLRVNVSSTLSTDSDANQFYANVTVAAFS